MKTHINTTDFISHITARDNMLFKFKDDVVKEEYKPHSPFKTPSPRKLRFVAVGVVTLFVLCVTLYSHYVDAKISGVFYG